MTTDKEPTAPSDHNNEPVTPAEIPFSEASVSHRHDDVFDIKTPDHITDVRWRDGAYEFTCRNGIALRIQVLSPGIVRLRYAQEGIFPADFSYAINPEFTPEKVSVRLDENDNEYLLVSELLQVVVAKADLKVKFYDLDDRVICEDGGGFAARRTVMKGWCDLSVEHKCTKKFSFYGLGDKTCGSDLTGHTFENWCTDSYGFGRGSDPLYRAIPFYYALHQQLAYGIFLDNPFRSRFDFNSNESGATRFSVDGGEMNYYFIYGPEMLDVARAYARLTGVHELPPMWALGYHQCRWSYYPESVVRDLANRFRKENIPCDAIYFDIDYMDGYRCFTWNEQHFPSPKQLIADLKAQYFQTVVMIDPGIKDDPDYHVFKEGVENGMFLKTADGDIAKAPVWPGFCAFPDFTSAKVREWWGNLYHDMYDNLGVAGFWNDMNEPAVFHVNHKTLPDHVVHYYEGHGGSHRKAHNIYGQQMSRASWEGYRQLQPQKRPYLLTRATFSGGQRYSAVWTGDNGSDWEQLQIANIQCQRLAVSGFSFCGTDIGGFTGCEDGELFVRWLQLAVFHPLMRTHSKGIHAAGDGLEILHDGEADENADSALSSPLMKSQEPWSFGAKWTDLARKAIELRYCMLPSLYTAMWLHSLDGTPVLRHMIFADVNEPKYRDHERDFLFGEHLLVSPVIQSKVQRQGVLLPKGTWYYFWTGQPVSGDVFINVMPDQIPFFVREGAVLPVYPIRQSTTERPVDELTLYVYYKNGTETSHLYEDAGQGYGYTEGDFSLKVFETQGRGDSFTLQQRKEGAFQPEYRRVKVYLVGFPAFVGHCSVDGREMPIKEIRLRDRSLYTVTIQDGFSTITWTAQGT